MESTAIATQSITLRPQPLGIFAGAAALLLLPDTGEPTQGTAIEELLSGSCETELPIQWLFFREAVQGNIALARELVEPVAASGNELGEYNLFVLAPSMESYARLHRSLSVDLQQLLDVAAFSAGVIANFPEEFDLDHELRAWAMACAAAAEIEKGNFVVAREKLAQAIGLAHASSPLLEAILIAQSAQIGHGCLESPLDLITKEYESAIAIAKQHRLAGFVAELWMQLGMVLQQSATGNKATLPAAIRAYQAALQTPFQAEKAPRLFAELHNNLGLAYLAMPESGASNQLRTGIAIQSFRNALSAVTPESNGELWARIKMNMANALQYAPSSHPEGNLIQAVKIYDEVLSVRTRARDPVAYALVLLNQAIALAHLGIFKPSLEKASEAYKLFQWHDQSEQASAARELVEQVNDALTGAPSNPSTKTIADS